MVGKKLELVGWFDGRREENSCNNADGGEGTEESESI